MRANQGKTVYTPQFFVGGAELRSWQGALRDKVRQLNALPAAADMRVQAGIAPSGALALNAEATRARRSRARGAVPGARRERPRVEGDAR